MEAYYSVRGGCISQKILHFRLTTIYNIDILMGKIFRNDRKNNVIIVNNEIIINNKW